MNTPPVDMTTNPIDLTVELRSADGSSTEFYQADEERVRETLRLLAAPQLFAQRHLQLASQHCASMIPCKGIDMILVRTFARTPLTFPLDLPLGLFDIVEQPEAGRTTNRPQLNIKTSRNTGSRTGAACRWRYIASAVGRSH